MREVTMLVALFVAPIVLGNAYLVLRYGRRWADAAKGKK